MLCQNPPSAIEKNRLPRYNLIGVIIVKTMRQRILSHVLEEYGTEAEYPFSSSPDTAVLRHTAGRKWYGIIMNIPYDRLGLDRQGSTDIINVKCDPIISGSIIAQGKAYPAYHMNKEKWISLLLDGSVSENDIYPLLSLSYSLTSAVKKARKSIKQDDFCN